MAVEFEVERLVTRLVGDSGQFTGILDQAIRDVKSTSEQIQQVAKEAQAQAQALEADARHLGPATQAALSQYATAVTNLQSSFERGEMFAADFVRENERLEMERQCESRR